MNTEGVRATIDVTANNKGMQETINEVSRLKNEINSLDPATVKLATSIAKLSTQLQKQQTEAAKTAGQLAKEEAQLIKNSALKDQNALKTEKLRLQVEKLGNTVNKSSSSFSISSMKLAAMGINFTNIIGLTKRLGSATQKLIQESADYIETQNLFEVSMGRTTEKATKFVNEMSRAFNLNDKTLKNAVGTFNLMATQMGLTNEQGLIFSETLTKLAVDTSSLRNTDVETALTKLRAGISGQVKPLREWGIDITESTLKQEALANGITKSTSQMSYAEKSILRYSAILKQTTADQGDYARTLESPAQLLKQIREQIQALGIAIGNVLLPMLYKVLTPLLSIIMVLKEIFVWLGTLFKISTKFGDTSANTALNIAEDTEEALGGAVKNAKALKKYLGGFDELNNVSPSSTAGAGAGASSPSVGIDPEFLKLLTTYDNKMGEVANKAADIRNKILEWLGFTIDENGEIQKLNDGMTNFEKIVTAVGIIMGGWTISKLIPIIGGIVNGVKGLWTALQSVWHVVEAIVTFTGQAPIANLAGITAVITGIVTMVNGIKDVINGEIVTGILEVVRGVSLIVAGVALLTGNLVPALIALGVAWRTLIAQFLVEHWDQVSGLITTIASWIKEHIIDPVVGFVMSIAGWINEHVIQPVIDFFVPIVETLQEVFEFIYDEVSEIVSTIWENIKIFIDKVWEILRVIIQINEAIAKALYEYVIKPIGEFFKSIGEWFIQVGAWLKEHVVDPIFEFFKKIGDFFYEHAIKPMVDKLTWLRDTARDIFKNIVEFVVTFISEQFKAILNGVLGSAESAINGFIHMLNKAADIINKIPGVKIDKINDVEFKRFEAGGIPEIGSLFVAGEGKTTEFVGDFGGRTNVVNEKQLEAAMYNALIKANNNTTDTEQYINEIYIGGNKTDTILNKRRVRRQNMLGKASV